MKQILLLGFLALGFAFNIHEEHTVNDIDKQCVDDHCPN
jgi:hypothetical protein